MSNVYKRNRTQSPLDVINKSKELLKETYFIIMNENKVPKKHRYFIGKSLYDSANKIVSCTFCANNIFPKCKDDLIKRRTHQNDALYECALFLNLLDTYSDILINVSYKDVEELAILANSIKALITAWIKSDTKQFEKFL